MHSGEHPAQALEGDVRKAHGRARVAMAALVVTALIRVYNVGARWWQSGLVQEAQAGRTPEQAVLERSDALVQVGAVFTLLILVVTGVVFLRWLHKTVALTRALGGDTLRFTPKDAVLGFIVPIWNISRPYQVVRDVHDHLAPDAVPEPQVQVRADDAMGYRQVAMVAPPQAVKVPHASIAAWWGFFWVGNIFANIAGRQQGQTLDSLLMANTFNNISDVIDVVAAALGVLMVRVLDARLAERFRRVRYNRPEDLQAAGIEIAPAVSAARAA